MPAHMCDITGDDAHSTLHPSNCPSRTYREIRAKNRQTIGGAMNTSKLEAGSSLSNAISQLRKVLKCGSAGWAAGGLLAVLSAPVAANETAAATSGSATPADTLQEVVVTATRQVTALSKVPMSVVAIAPEQMDSQGLRNISDITRVTPGVSLTPNGGVAGTNQVISIRGIASTVGSPTTGVYVDDTPIQSRPLGSANNVYPQLFDLARVEVLRGPQGTLFGAGAEGGAVRFISSQPGLRNYTGYDRAELAFTDNGAPTFEAGAAFGGPIARDKVGFRVSAWYRREGGYISELNEFNNQIASSDSNNLSSTVLRGAVTLSPNDRFSATVSLMHQRQKLDDDSSFFSTLSNPDAQMFRASRVFVSPNDTRFTLPNLDLRYEGSFFDVISTTSYFDRSSHLLQDYTHFISSVLFGSPYMFLPGELESAVHDDLQRNWTQEIRIQSRPGGRMNWVIGGYYGKAKQSSHQVNYDPNLNALLARFGAGPLPLLPGDHAFDQFLAASDKQEAAFGQADLEIRSGFKVTAGVRVAKVDVALARTARGPIAGGAADFASSSSEKPVTPRFGVSYQVTADTLLYASAAKGYRIGGINGPQLSFCASTLAAIGLTSTPPTYASDSLWSYEAGAKGRLLDGRLSLAASAFNIEWKNIQQLVNIAACRGSFIVNVGTARSTGFDLSADVKITPQVTVGGSIGKANARITQDFTGPILAGVPTFFARDGDKVGGPPLTATLSGDYEHPLSADRRLYVHGDYQYIGRGPTLDLTVFGTDPLSRRSDSYNQVALRTGLRSGALDVSVFINNLLNEAPILNSQRGSLSPTDTLFTQTSIRPRTIGVTATYRQ
jgi:outer membrane receptor protein involved in Fe transport